MSNKEKQIEEIKNVLIHTCKRIRTREDDIMQDHYAKALYNAGYRKQSDEELIDKTKEEVAWEIFAEIDNILYRFAYPSLTAIGTINVINAEGYHLRTRDYAELKKKYTKEVEIVRDLAGYAVDQDIQNYKENN